MLTPKTSYRVQGLNGAITVAGDKSISHRSIMFGAMAKGETVVSGLLEGEDILSTIKCFRLLGADINRDRDGLWHINGVGVGGLKEPDDVLDFGNAGTGARLAMGVLASYPFVSFLTGDASLRKRPMARVIDPLSEMGAVFKAREGKKMPLMISGSSNLKPITYELPVASAQVKSAILLAGLNLSGKTTVIEKLKTRDHTERMLKGFGAKIISEEIEGKNYITLNGRAELKAQNIFVSGDISSAAFPIVAGLIVPDSKIIIKNVGLNPLRAGIITTLLEMQADLKIENQREVAGEPVGDIVVATSELAGVDIPEDRTASMIDEYPIIGVAAAFAKGKTTMRGLSELRVKESDRFTAIVKGLTACGVKVETQDDDIIIYGTGEAPNGDAQIITNLDHRIAMSFLIMGMASKKEVEVDDVSPIATSFPEFENLMKQLGAKIV
ncbi:MAG: 3-phosphoshikimate 1-carboxyvinyltransferase [Alphaproteobacteria bacterium]